MDDDEIRKFLADKSQPDTRGNAAETSCTSGALIWGSTTLKSRIGCTTTVTRTASRRT